jgi:hypothetical protein
MLGGRFSIDSFVQSSRSCTMLMNGSNSNTKDKRCVHPNAPALHYLRRTRTRFTPIARSVHADVLYHTFFILTLSLLTVILGVSRFLRDLIFDKLQLVAPRCAARTTHLTAPSPPPQERRHRGLAARTGLLAFSPCARHPPKPARCHCATRELCSDPRPAPAAYERTIVHRPTQRLSAP